MKFTPFLRMASAAVLIMSAVACGKEDNSDPAGTISLNMMDEANGKTLLGNSDVYIDDSYNFYGPSCSISGLGKKNGLKNASPALDGTAPRVAVEQGKAYQIFLSAAIRKFPSGESALNITGDYYNVYAVSQIKQNDVVTGANVKFVLSDVPGYGLPEYNKNIGSFNHYDYPDGYEIILPLPTSDFEVEPVFASSNYYTLEYEKSGKNLIIRLVDYKSSDVFGFYIRIKGSYTSVYGNVR